MSYHVDVETSETTDHRQAADLSVGTMGGGERGLMVQVTMRESYAQLTRPQTRELIRVLVHAAGESLESFDSEFATDIGGLARRVWTLEQRLQARR